MIALGARVPNKDTLKTSRKHGLLSQALAPSRTGPDQAGPGRAFSRFRIHLRAGGDLLPFRSLGTLPYRLHEGLFAELEMYFPKLAAFFRDVAAGPVGACTWPKGDHVLRHDSPRADSPREGDAGPPRVTWQRRLRNIGKRQGQSGKSTRGLKN